MLNQKMADTKNNLYVLPSNLHKIKMAAKIISFGLIVTKMVIISKNLTILKANLVYLRGVEWVHGLFLFPLVLGKI